MAIFPEAQARLYKDMYVCRKCKTKFRAARKKVLAGKVSCRSCKSKEIRPLKSKGKK